MSISEVEVYNLALSACGADSGIVAPDERSREADLCRTWYAFTRDEVIAAAPWPSVRAYARLALLAERDRFEAWTPADPAPRWTRQYSVPADLLHPYHLADYSRFEYFGSSISTAAVSPILHYNRRVETPGHWDHSLLQAVVAMLAARIARPLTGSSAVIQENFQLAYQKIQDVQTTAANSEDTQTEDLPDWLQARGTSLQAPTKFLYPFQTLSIEPTR